jgi:UDP-N-acetylglucosamine 4,6-dehydratase
MEAHTMRDILIIGGTGTLGRALLERFDPTKVIVFSRDELKQHQLRQDYPGIQCILGDIRFKKSIARCYSHPITKVFHVAALKHVDILEENPEEAYQTNIQGTINSAEIAKEKAVKEFYFSSTDKAVMPINVYGMTKAISERMLLNLNENRQPFDTRFNVYRWGNIIGSRGSVIGLFVKSLKEKNKVYITDKRMTRFWLRIENAIDFMLANVSHSKPCFPKMKSASVLQVIDAVSEILGIRDYEVTEIGIRKGEKLHECIYSSHDYCIRSDNSPVFSKDELIELIKPIVRKI